MHALILLAALHAAPHADSLLSPAQRAALERHADCADRASLALLHAGPAGAAEILEAAVAVERQVHGLVRSGRLVLLLGVAHQRARAGELAKAAPAHAERLAALERYYGPHDWRTINSRWDVYTARLMEKHPEKRQRWYEARTQRHQVGQLIEAGNARAAIPVAEAQLKVMRETVGAGHPDTLEAMNRLAVARIEAGEDASALLTDSLRKRKETLGPVHPEYAEALHNFGWIYLKKGDADKALSLFRESLALTRAALGHDCSLVIYRLDSLAHAHLKKGDDAEATRLLTEAVALLERYPDLSPISQIRTRNNLASIHDRKGDHRAALPIMRRVAEIARKQVGTAHPDYLLAIHNLGAVLHHLGEHREALTLGEESLSLRRKLLGPNHPQCALTLIGIAKCHLGLKDLTAARARIEESLNIGDSPEALTVLADVHERQGDRAKADELRKKAATLRKAP